MDATLKNLLLREAAKDPNSPFIRKNGELFARFDAVDIRAKTDEAGNTLVPLELEATLVWRGLAIKTVSSALQYRIDLGDTFALTSIDGRLQIVIE